MPEVTLLDGATGTELDRRGVDISLPLWSARAITDAHDVLRQIHVDYLEAGAELITACTFRTHRRSLVKGGIDDPSGMLTRRAVEIARIACEQACPSARVLGSVAPLEDCYRPELAPDADACLVEHRLMMNDLLEAGADTLLIETMSCEREASAAVAAAHQLAADRWMISFCTRGEGPPGVLLSGEPLVDMLPHLEGAQAVGVNCVPAPGVEREVALLRKLLPDDVAVMAYANIGYADDEGNWVLTDALEPKRYAEYASRWIDAGATIVGGCCGTTPATISAIQQLRIEN